jgi:hypothetical protein
MTTGGIDDCESVREKSAVTVFPEPIEEAVLDTILLAGFVEFLCDLAQDIGVRSEFIFPT